APLLALACLLGLTSCSAARSGTRPLAWGVFAPDDGAGSSDLSAIALMAGDQPDYVERFAAIDEPVPIGALDGISNAGMTPILTLEPWVPGRGVDQPDYSLARIAAGHHDAALTRWAGRLAAWGRPLLLRFAHEPNSDWYPWSVGSNGNDAGDYVAAWRHIHDVFGSAGADQVSFVWAANVPYPGSSDLAATYPGPQDVDYLGLDGYNWGDGEGRTWQHPSELLGAGLAQLRELDGDKPILVTEVASNEGAALGTDKARWIGQLVDYLSREDRVAGFVWFQADKERDWRFNSTPEAQDAMKDALAALPG
ncbi:MAG: glycosyl hydrolase, partial [Candidatus Nanopelagicales bacterium]